MMTDMKNQLWGFGVALFMTGCHTAKFSTLTKVENREKTTFQNVC
jgi:hypothetical protein